MENLTTEDKKILLLAMLGIDLIMAERRYHELMKKLGITTLPDEKAEEHIARSEKQVELRAMESFSCEIPFDDKEKMKAFNIAMNELADSIQEYTKEEAKKLNVSEYCARAIVYLRSRSRWTQEKEDQLIEWDQNGEELPNVFIGEF